jgi:biotin operon repressor
METRKTRKPRVNRETLDYVEAALLAGPVSVSAIWDHLGCAPKSVYRYFDRLRAEGMTIEKITESAPGQPATYRGTR